MKPRSAFCWLLAQLIFIPEDEGDMILWKIGGLSAHWTAICLFSVAPSPALESVYMHV
jgi:hypothetical protein